MNNDPEFKKKLLNNIYLPKGKDEPVKILEDTYSELQKLQPILNKIKENKIYPTGNKMADMFKSAKEKQVITTDEYKRLMNLEKLIDKAIAVDSFSFKSYDNYQQD